MDKLIPILEKIKPTFETYLKNHIESYIETCANYDNPKWYQYIMRDRLNSKYITIKSSQANIGFVMHLDEILSLKELEIWDKLTYKYNRKIYEKFRSYKYDFIRKNYPSIL